MQSPVYLTRDLPPLGGRIKERAEDFLVDEQPLYQPCGSGEHIYLFVEKRNISTLRAARILAQHFHVPLAAIGFAGLKDKVALTRQLFSVHTPGKSVEDFPMLQHERMGVLWADQHTNKLKRGHLAGNRFSIKIRGVPPVPLAAARLAHEVVSRLERTGVPNRIGEQRFGYTGRNHLVGRALVKGDAKAALDALLAPVDNLPEDTQAAGRQLFAQGRYAEALEAFFKESRTERRILGALARGATPQRAVKAIERDEEQFFITAFQSAVFNTVLDQRLRDGTFDRLLPGDIAFKHDNRAAFDVSEAELNDELLARLQGFEISPSGPMWGVKMKRASGAIDELELKALLDTGVTLDDLAAYDRHRRLTGERRPLRVQLTDPDVEGGVDEHGAYVRIAFDLPRGAFATTVLREIMKTGEGSPQSPSAASHDSAEE